MWICIWLEARGVRKYIFGLTIHFWFSGSLPFMIRGGERRRALTCYYSAIALRAIGFYSKHFSLINSLPLVS